MLEAGADGLAFDPIVAFGENAAEPHHVPGHRVLEEGDVMNSISERSSRAITPT
jgi:Xaa-Pro aminopeptidase